MTLTSYILGIVSAASVLVVVVELLRRKRLRERHAVWWLMAGIAALLVGVFPGILEAVARLLGIEVPTNLVFFISIAVLFLVCLQYASELTRLENTARDLTENQAILELRLRELEERLDRASPQRGQPPGRARSRNASGER